MDAYPFIVGTITYATREPEKYRYAYCVAGVEVADDGETFITVWRYKTDGGQQLFANGYTNGSDYDARRRFPLAEFDPYHCELEDYYSHELFDAMRTIYGACLAALASYRNSLYRIAGYADMDTSSVADGVQRFAHDW